MDESSKTSEVGERVGNLAETIEGGNTSEDVMVEILGSDVFVDGVRSHEDDDKIDAVVSEDDEPGDKNKTTDDMDIDSELPNNWSEPIVGEAKNADLVKDVGSSETVVDRGEKEIIDEEGVVAEASIIVIEKTQLIDNDDDLVEETRVVVDEKKLVEEINEVESPLEDDDVSHRGKTEVLGETVVDASAGGPVESSRPIGGSTTSIEELDGSEYTSADTIVATVYQITLATTKLLANQEEEEEENANVENGVECHPSLVLETSSSLGEVNLNPKGDSDGVRQADVTEEPSLKLLAPVSVKGKVKKIKEDTIRSLEVVVSDEETQTEDKSQIEDAGCCIEEADDGDAFAADSEQKAQINVSGKTEEVGEETISSTFPIDQDLKPEGHLDCKLDASADDVKAPSHTAQATEANMEVVTGSSEKVEEAQEEIEQEDKEEPVGIVEYEEVRPRIDDNHQKMESGTVITICDHREVLETTLAEPLVVGFEDNNTNDQEAGSPSQSSQPTTRIDQGESLEEDITNAESDPVLSEHILCESTEMDVQVTEHGECVLTVNEIVLSSSTNNDIQVVVVENSSEYIDGNLIVNLPIDLDREHPATDIDEKQLVAEAEVVETQFDTIPTEEEKVIGEEHGTADYDNTNVLKTETNFASYNLPQEKEDDFTVSDLVWGKVRDHLLWPGQIFDPSAASEAALQDHHEENSYLVAYFGDRTFTWMNEASMLKPLRNHFSQLEKQSNSEAFRNAVDCALEEVSRRAQLSLTCSCISRDEKIDFQIVENDGINLEFCKREGLVNASSNTTFEPDNLFEYVMELAQLPYGGADSYELAVAKAQLLSFYQLKGGFSQLPEFQDGGELVEGDTGNLKFDELSADDEYSPGGGQEEENKLFQKGSLKRKHNLRDITYPIKKGRSMKELMSETTNTNDNDQTRSTKVAMNATTVTPPVPKPSFKIGACISRVASQLTGSFSLKQQHADPEDATERSMNEKEPSLHDLLSRLQVAAQEPLKEDTMDNGNISFEVIRSFFSDLRNCAVLEQNPELAKMGGGGGGGKRKRPCHLDDESTEAFEFEDMNDSYWTDRVIENEIEDELLPSDDGGAVGATTAKRLENHIVPVELKPLKTGRRPYNKRRHLETNITTNHGNNGLVFATAEKPDYIDPNAPAELVLIFSEFGFFPATEVSLNRMFKRFGPLRESQTALDRDTCRARVVFKKCCDAEVACSSAGRFHIFGPVHVIYQLNYTVSPEFKTMAVIEDGGGHHEEDYIH